MDATVTGSGAEVATRASPVVDRPRPRTDTVTGVEVPTRDAPTDVVAPVPGAPSPAPRPPRRTARSDLVGAVATPARRGRLVVVVAVLALAAAMPSAAQAALADARAAARTSATDRASAADWRAAVAADRATAMDQAAEAAGQAALALEARNDQRARLGALGLDEATVEDFLARSLANTRLVEYRRDAITGDVDRQAQEIPQMEDCLEVATQSVNRAFNVQFGDAPPPAPSDLCRALLGP